MITVTIHAIMFDAEYEFCLDPDTVVGDLCEEIGEMICQKEQCYVSGNPEHFMLFCPERKSIISHDATLREYGIVTGDTLFFG